MSHKSEYTMSAQELIQETIRLRALEKQFTKERGEFYMIINLLKLQQAGALAGLQSASRFFYNNGYDPVECPAYADVEMALGDLESEDAIRAQ